MRTPTLRWLSTPLLLLTLLAGGPLAQAYYDPGIQRWINRDPIGETGFEQLRNPMMPPTGDGPNVQTLLGNDAVNRFDYFGLAGGPYHPPPGVDFKCKSSDSCTLLSGKMVMIMKMIASHTGWDRTVPPPRGGGRHADEIADLWRAYAKCQRIAKAKNCSDPKPPSCWDRVIMKVPGSDETWEQVQYGCLVVGGTALCGAVIIGTGGAAAPVLMPVPVF